MITEEEYKKALVTIHKYYDQLSKMLNEVKCDISNLPKFHGVKKDDYIGSLNISTRLRSVLMSYGFDRCDKVSELEKLCLSDLQKLRNVGKETALEYKELCLMAGVFRP